MTEFLPRANAPAVSNDGRFTRETYDALRRAFESLSSRQSELETAQAAVAAILGSLGAASVEELQSLGNLLEGKQDASEVLDALAGILGVGIVVRTGGSFRPRSMADTATITWANANGTAGNPSASLADLADSGTGTFKLLTRDAKGRLSGTADGTTTNVPEGTNLYFTAARVRDTILTGLSTATNAVITATDTVLTALGKLQAQISGLIVQTITDGDTTHAPSGDAVFDALAVKQPLAGTLTTLATITPSADRAPVFTGGSTASTIALLSGTYAPTLTGIANVDAVSAANPLQYMRVGNVVTVSGRIDVDPTAAANTLTQVAITLPVASNFTTNAQLGGAGAAGQTPYSPALVIGDATNERALFFFYSSGTVSVACFFTFTYLVV